MYKKENRFGTIIIILAAFIFIRTVKAQVGFSGDISAVSTYVWRGLKANNGPALQSTASFGYGIVSFGFWGSSIDFGDDLEVETDLFAEVALPIGDISSVIGFTAYMLDFKSFNEYADAELEAYANLGYGPLSIGLFYVPKQNSTRENELRSNYWIEITGATSLLGADLAAILSYGTYSSRWMSNGPTKDAVALLTFSAGKALSEEVSVFWKYTVDLDSGFENILYFGGTNAF